MLWFNQFFDILKKSHKKMLYLLDSVLKRNISKYMYPGSIGFILCETLGKDRILVKYQSLFLTQTYPWFFFFLDALASLRPIMEIHSFSHVFRLLQLEPNLVPGCFNNINHVNNAFNVNSSNRVNNIWVSSWQKDWYCQEMEECKTSASLIKY